MSRRAQPMSRLLVALAGLLLAALVVPAGGVAAHGYRLGKIAIGHIWAPPPRPDADGIAVYGPVLNMGEAPAHLIGVSSPVADEARFRVVSKGEMRWPRQLELRPGKPFSLATWREHIWLSGLHRRPRDGESFPMTLDFGPDGKITVEVEVQSSPAHGG